jgi:formylglycine-generating enzyme required for sulfatase activity
MSDIFTKTEKGESESRMAKVIAGILILTLIGIVSITVFLWKDGDGHRQERPQEDATKEPEPKPLQAEGRGDIQPEAGNVETNSIGMKLVYIPAGSFVMGSGLSARQLARERNEGKDVVKDEFPQHEVCSFWMGQTEVTQGQYTSVMNAQPWSGKEYVQEDANNPAVYVSWDDAVEFCRKLSHKDGKTYRLPTEIEWEYACRAGTTNWSVFSDSDWGSGAYGWFSGNTSGAGQLYAHPVGQTKPNPWRLYDMQGNVWEWCSNCYKFTYGYHADPSGELRSMRGGSWQDPASGIVGVRSHPSPDHRDDAVGFRVVRSQP